MKIYNSFMINKYSQRQSFKSNNDEWHVFGIDEGGKTKREYIRQWQKEYYTKYQDIYENEGRKSEYEINKIISGLIRKPVPIDNKKLNELNLSNLYECDRRIYRGAMLSGERINDLKAMHGAGLRRIIALGDAGSKRLNDECKKFDMEYLNIRLDGYETVFSSKDEVEIRAEKYAREILNYDEYKTDKYVKNYVKSWEKSSRKFIKNFVKFIQIMQKGNVYIGCEYGSYATDKAMFFDYMFNPKMNHKSYMTHSNRMLIDCAEYLYYNLTDADKHKMGWSKEFDEQFLERLDSLRTY